MPLERSPFLSPQSSTSILSCIFIGVCYCRQASRNTTHSFATFNIARLHFCENSTVDRKHTPVSLSPVSGPVVFKKDYHYISVTIGVYVSLFSQSFQFNTRCSLYFELLISMNGTMYLTHCVEISNHYHYAMHKTSYSFVILQQYSVKSEKHM